MENETNNKTLDYLNPEMIAGMKNLDFVARMIVEGFLVGLHKSPYHGFSVEFSQHRQYMPGDNIRDIDWKVYGRTNRHYIKQYTEETNLKAHILLDVSGSMTYSSGKISKLAYATYLAAAFAYLLVKQRDAVGLVTFSDEIHRYFPPKASASYLQHVLRELHNIQPKQSGTAISETLHLMAEKVKRRGLLILLTEFLHEPPQKILEGLKHFRHYKHEILVFNVMDPMDRRFDFREDAVFEDLETGERLKTQPYFLREKYREKIDAFYGELENECRRFNIDFNTILTSDSFDRALIRYLLKRKKLH